MTRWSAARCGSRATRSRRESRRSLRSIAPPPTPKFAGATWHIHQFQGDAVGFPGFSSTVDIDRFNPLELGISGGRVSWLQQRVGCAVDGSFGPATEMAVRAFQESHGLVVTGTMDVATFAALTWL